MKKKITIVDYGLGNILSAKQSFIRVTRDNKINADVIISNLPSDIANSHKSRTSKHFGFRPPRAINAFSEPMFGWSRSCTSPPDQRTVCSWPSQFTSNRVLGTSWCQGTIVTDLSSDRSRWHLGDRDRCSWVSHHSAPYRRESLSSASRLSGKWWSGSKIFQIDRNNAGYAFEACMT